MRFSRSHIETQFDCPRKRYINYHHGGKGIVPKGTSTALATGTLTHDLLAIGLAMLKEDGFPLNASVLRERFQARLTEFRQVHSEVEFYDTTAEVAHAYEVGRQAALAEALARLWLKFRLPVFKDYEVLAVEEEFNVPVGQHEMMMRIDAVLVNQDGLLCPLEFKTTSTDRSDYLESFRYDTQTMAHVWGCEQHYGKEVEAVFMEHLYKGYKRQGVYYTPLINAWKKPIYDAMTGEEESEYSAEQQREKGWMRFDVWSEQPLAEAGMSPIENWIDHHVPFTVAAQHLLGYPIYRSMDLLEEWLDQVESQEDRNEIGLTVIEEEPLLLSQFFPARRNRHCFLGRYFSRCPYLPICYNEVTLNDAIASEMFEEREPHHEQEFDE